jgi:hypothetical protein
VLIFGPDMGPIQYIQGVENRTAVFLSFFLFSGPKHLQLIEFERVKKVA